MNWVYRLGFGYGRTFTKGQQYFKRGAIRMLAGDEESIRASVSGTLMYAVHVTLKGRTLLCSCTCPAGSAWSVCKHVWAALLAAADRSLLTAVDGIRGLSVRTLNKDAADDAEDGSSFELVPPGHRRTAPDVTWRRQLQILAPLHTRPEAPEPKQTLYFVISGSASELAGMLVLQLGTRRIGKTGPGKLTVNNNSVPKWQFPNAEDQRILAMLGGAPTYHAHGPAYEPDTISSAFRIGALLGAMVLPAVCATGRCLWIPTNRSPETDWVPLQWEDDAWTFTPEVTIDESADAFVFGGELSRNGVRHPASAAGLVTRDFLITGSALSRLNCGDADAWLRGLRTTGPIRVPRTHRLTLIEELARIGLPANVPLPEEIQLQVWPFEEVLMLTSDERGQAFHGTQTGCRLRFRYFGVWMDVGSGAIVQSGSGRYWKRDLKAEAAAETDLRNAGGVLAEWPERRWLMDLSVMVDFVRQKDGSNWRFEYDGRIVRTAGTTGVEVRSGVDWFELHGWADFGGHRVPLPDLLRAAENSPGALCLTEDGSYGVVPREWLAQFGPALELGLAHETHHRFRRGQAGLLDALLITLPEATFDEGFRRIHDRLANFRRIQPIDTPDGFQGVLRTYQRDGVGWLDFLRDFQFGGCLADDMGLGKTIQVLALLQRLKRSGGGPVLVVAPKSLIFNWKEEARRFTPELRVLDFTGTHRASKAEVLTEHDLILTTYGTLQKDITTLRKTEFDTVILDEAQAIKNPQTNSAKAARLLRSTHRLALTGTPVENHVGELWSLFEFLNPGLLGSAGAFRRFEDMAASHVNPVVGTVLSRALRPFILRRTKEQVARDLPPKTEQTIFCELDREQRRHYNELRDYYRFQLMTRVDRDGISKSRIHVLEALLRLRQAACHAGLVNDKARDVASAKVDTLLTQLDEVVSEGHKALVFSQFTSFLAFVKERLDTSQVPYAYLDGRTRDRKRVVDAFQTDPDVRVFLISLKAGGLGLNLTAADYVFILDPWWNPAVEAQAVDRTHRIGQTQRVFAYRLIARDTVEERVLALQQTKKELFEAIIDMKNSMVGSLTREDIELLLQ